MPAYNNIYGPYPGEQQDSRTGVDWATFIDLLEVGGSIYGGMKAGEAQEDIAKMQIASSEKIAQASLQRAYPGQKSIAKLLGPYLMENLGVGLTEKEKETYRGAGRTGILKGVQSAQRGASKILASQGLRGGRVADILSDIGETSIPQFARLESDISQQDIGLKRQRIQDVLGFLNLKAGLEEGDIASILGKSPASNVNQNLSPEEKTKKVSDLEAAMERIYNGRTFPSLSADEQALILELSSTRDLLLGE
jgi:hypothetical protein